MVLHINLSLLMSLYSFISLTIARYCELISEKDQGYVTWPRTSEGVYSLENLSI